MVIRLFDYIAKIAKVKVFTIKQKLCFVSDGKHSNFALWNWVLFNFIVL